MPDFCKFQRLYLLEKKKRVPGFTFHKNNDEPISSGSGMRIKIIEGMALGKVIISTTIGAEGINCTSGENIIIADSQTILPKQSCTV